MITALAAILIFGGIIFVHELGHFTVAKLTGVTVYEFSIGMGPALWKREKGGTLYSLRLLPIGGYVMLEGEDEAVDSPGSFSNKPVLTRISVLLAGAFNNLVLGYVILVILTAISGYVGTTTIVKFNDGAQSSAQLMLGDRVTRVNGHRVRTSNDITYELLRDRDGLIDMTVVREGETLTLPVQFRMEQLEEGEVLTLARSLYLTYPVNWSLSIVKQVWGSFLDLLTGRYAVNQLSGPVGVVSAIGQATKLGFESFLLMAAFITINIGIFNLIPFPILDGGKVVLSLIEAAVGRPINQRIINGIMTVSVGLMIALMLYVTWNDIFRLFG